ncbi:hypothetical protein [Mitsuokella multacida]|uniref:hypothetical protein n=1 Tax=Mitsuokella multacida TaxID=52226 RepID=UPI0039F45DA7
MLNHFNFKALDDGDFLITNDYGRALFVSPEEFQRFLRQDFDGAEALYQRLHVRTSCWTPWRSMRTA